MDKRWRIAHESLNQDLRIPGPSLETFWIPAGWGKTLCRSQSSIDLKQQPRLRNSGSMLIPKQKSLRHLKSSTNMRHPIGLFILEIPTWVNMEAIIAVFSKFGSIVNVSIDKKEMFASVDYESSTSVNIAIQELNGKVYFGGPLILKERFDKYQTVDSLAVDSDLSTDIRDFDMFTVYIASMPQHIQKSDLKEGFERFGVIKRIHIGNKAKDLNFAMVTFQEQESASMAIEFLMSNTMFGLRLPKVEYARKVKCTLSRSVSRLKMKTSSADLSKHQSMEMRKITQGMAQQKYHASNPSDQCSKWNKSYT